MCDRADNTAPLVCHVTLDQTRSCGPTFVEIYCPLSLVTETCALAANAAQQRNKNDVFIMKLET